MKGQLISTVRKMKGIYQSETNDHQYSNDFVHRLKTKNHLAQHDKIISKFYSSTQRRGTALQSITNSIRQITDQMVLFKNEFSHKNCTFLCGLSHINLAIDTKK